MQYPFDFPTVVLRPDFSLPHAIKNLCPSHYRPWFYDFLLPYYSQTMPRKPHDFFATHWKTISILQFTTAQKTWTLLPKDYPGLASLAVTFEDFNSTVTFPYGYQYELEASLGSHGEAWTSSSATGVRRQTQNPNEYNDVCILLIFQSPALQNVMFHLLTTMFFSGFLRSCSLQLLNCEKKAYFSLNETWFSNCRIGQ